MKKHSTGIPVNKWIVEPLSPEVSSAISRLAQLEGVRMMAIMPDVHLSGDVCIGTVLATDSRLLPQAVGNDIGCGMSTMCFDCLASDLMNDKNAARILEGLYDLVPSNRHSRATARDELPQSLLEVELSDPKLEKAKSRDGRVQLGTLGRGNHFLEFQSDEQDRLWVTVHSGSRAMGQMIVNHHLKLSQKSNSGILYLKSDTDPGRAYLNDHNWACTYAELNRMEILDSVKDLMKSLFKIYSMETLQFSCNHNHVRPETHFGEKVYIHRKGSLSARDGELGIIPGSMGSSTYHTQGRGCPEALFSSSHGAGRLLSRGEARKKISVHRFEQQMEGVWFDHRMSRKLVDEAPSAYKSISSVMKAQKDLTRITRKLKPLLNYKGA